MSGRKRNIYPTREFVKGGNGRRRKKIFILFPGNILCLISIRGIRAGNTKLSTWQNLPEHSTQVSNSSHWAGNAKHTRKKKKKRKKRKKKQNYIDILLFSNDCLRRSNPKEVSRRVNILLVFNSLHPVLSESGGFVVRGREKGEMCVYTLSLCCLDSEICEK